MLIASQTGKAKHPAWFHNLMANPDAELWAGGRGGRLPRPGGGAVRSASGSGGSPPKLYPGYDDYQRRADAAGRRIPVVVCEPRDREAV